MIGLDRAGIKALIRDAITLAGCVCLVAAAAILSAPLGLAVAGVMLIAFGFILAWLNQTREPEEGREAADEGATPK